MSVPNKYPKKTAATCHALRLRFELQPNGSYGFHNSANTKQRADPRTDNSYFGMNLRDHCLYGQRGILPYSILQRNQRKCRMKKVIKPTLCLCCPALEFRQHNTGYEKYKGSESCDDVGVQIEFVEYKFKYVLVFPLMLGKLSMPTNRHFLAILLGTMAVFAMTRLRTEMGSITNRFFVSLESYCTTIHLTSYCRHDHEGHRWQKLWICPSRFLFKFLCYWNGGTSFAFAR